MPVDIKYELLCEQDIDELAAILLNNDVYEHIGGTPQMDEFTGFLRRSIQGPPPQRNTERWINYVARHAETGAILGRLEATVHHGYAEVAYLYGPKHWGNGYATQGLLWLHERLRCFSELRQFWATTLPQNTRSTSLLRKCGYFPAPKEGVPLLYSYEQGDLIFTRPSAA
jgi:RimJ/RimL family protein N-acetyltransferase